jgi:hypothetical protein
MTSIRMRASIAPLFALLISTPAFAGTDTVNNKQRTWAQTRAELNAGLQSVSKDVTLTTAAINNSFSADLGGAANVNNFQESYQNASSKLNLNAKDTLGSISATAAAIGNSASISVDSKIPGAGGKSTVNSSQFAFGVFDSALNMTGANVTAPAVGGAAITATSASIANSLNVTGKGDLTSSNLQMFNGDARSALNVSMQNITGDSTLTSAAIGNSASYDVKDAASVNVNNLQMAGYDPRAHANVTLGKINGNVTTTAAAISNSFSLSTLPSTAVLNVNTNQQNGAYNEAMVNLSLGDVKGSVTATAAAIGNSATISNIVK